MKKIIFTFLSIITFVTDSNAQQWDWAYDGDGVVNPKIAVLNNNIYLSGTFTTSCKVKSQTLSSSATGSGFLMKLDATGAIIWTKTFDASAVNICGVKASNGVIYIAGSFAGNLTGSSVNLNSAGDHDAFFAGFSENGVLQVAKSDGNSKYERIADFDVDSTIAVMGQFTSGSVLSGQTLNSTCSGSYNVFIAKYNLSGQNLWVKEIAGTTSNSGLAVSIRFDKNKTIITQGEFAGRMKYAGVDTGFCDACRPLLRFDANGNFVEYITDMQSGCSGCGYWVSYDTYIDAANNFYNLSSITCNICAVNTRLIKFKSQGQGLWDRNITGYVYTSYPSGSTNPAQISGSGADVYISGTSVNKIYFTGGDTLYTSSLFISKLDSGGNFKYVHTALPAAGVNINEMANDAAGDVYITGSAAGSVVFGATTVNTSNASDKFYIAKLSSQPLAVNEAAKDNQLVVSPNPSQGRISVAVKGTQKIANVCVYNMLGNCILSQPMQASSTIDLSNQPKGVYFVSMEGKDFKEMKRIVVE